MKHPQITIKVRHIQNITTNPIFSNCDIFDIKIHFKDLVSIQNIKILSNEIQAHDLQSSWRCY